MGISANLAENAQTLINLATSFVSLIQLSNSDVTLTPDQYNTGIIEFNGVIANDINITLPTKGTWKIYNATIGEFSVILNNGIGATLDAPQGSVTIIVSDPSAGILSAGGGGGGGGTGGVTSFDTRTGAVVLQSSDITSAGGALLVSPAFSGTPQAPTPAPGDNDTSIATTAFVGTALTSYAPLVSPALTGTPTAPTQSNASNNTDIATTAFVQNIVSAISGGLNYQGTWDATSNTPTLASGVGTKGFLYEVSVAGNTLLDGNSTWTVGDFVLFNGTVWQRIPAQTTGVASFNTRTGPVTLTSADVTGALGFTPANSVSVAGLAPLASPVFTGVPTAPTPAPGNNSTDIATTAFVSTSMGLYAPLNSPVLTGVPAAPTAATGTNTTQLASTAFVNATVTSTLAAYAPIASPSFTGRVQSPASSYTVVALGNASGTQTLNLAAASEWTMTIIGATTIAFTNTLPANDSQVVYLRLTNAGAFSVAWPASTKFAAKTAPVFTTAGVDLVGVKYDTTTSTYAVFVIGLNVG